MGPHCNTKVETVSPGEDDQRGQQRVIVLFLGRLKGRLTCFTRVLLFHQGFVLSPMGDPEGQKNLFR